jgi:elongation factor P
MGYSYQTSDFRNGLKVELDGDPYVITYFQFVKPGKGTAFTRTKLKNLISGNVIDRTFRSGETIQPADVEESPMQFLYEDGDLYQFMDMESYEQVGLHQDLLGSNSDYLIDNLEVQVLKFKSRPVTVVLPNFVEDEISYCEPGVKGNTAQGATKPATLACGKTVQVPLFIEQGERIRVDTRTHSYVSRVK